MPGDPRVHGRIVPIPNVRVGDSWVQGRFVPPPDARRPHGGGGSRRRSRASRVASTRDEPDGLSRAEAFEISSPRVAPSQPLRRGFRRANALTFAQANSPSPRPSASPVPVCRRQERVTLKYTSGLSPKEEGDPVSMENTGSGRFPTGRQPRGSHVASTAWHWGTAFDYSSMSQSSLWGASLSGSSTNQSSLWGLNATNQARA
jgi:hypothetical protein